MRNTMLPIALLVATAIAFAAPASPALGAGFSLNLTGPATGVVGVPIAILASGQNPPLEEYWFPSWLEVATLDAAVAPTCPQSHQDTMHLAVATGGEWLAFARREQVRPDGSWTAALGFTPKRTGTWLICGYTADGATNTLASAGMSVTVTGASATPIGPGPGAGSPPVNTKAPRVIRAGRKLVCDPGVWTGAPDGYAYRWLVDEKRKRGAFGRKLRITRGLRGHRVSCSVRAENADGATTAVSRPRRIA